MKTPEIVLLLGVVIALAVAGAFVLSSGSNDVPPNAATDPAIVSPDAPGSGPPVTVSADSPPQTVDPDRPELRVTTPASAPTESPGYGILDGRVLLASDAAGKVDQYTITVEEMANSDATIGTTGRPPVRLTRGFKAEPDESPLYFAFDRVPFSDLGYRVTVFVPGLNGSSQIVRVTENEWSPSVTLALTGGSPFSLRLIDQLHDPHVDQDLSLMPVGLPAGRPLLRGRTDNFGSVVFESVLAGEYEVRLDNQVVGPVTVEPPGYVHDEIGVGAQSARLVVPRGRTVRVEVFDDAGYGLADAEVIMFAIDTVENRRFTASTEASGTVEFRFVPDGNYQLDVRAPGRQPTSRTLRIRGTDDLEPQRVRLPLL